MNSQLNKGKVFATKNAKVATQKVFTVFDDFKAFINKGSVVDLAVGIIMGAAMSAIVQSLVKDIFTPFIGLAIGSNLENTFILLACQKDPATGIRVKTCKKSDFNTVDLAGKAGAVTWNYGNFIQAVINFLIISVIVFFVVKLYAAMTRRKDVVVEKTKKDCGYCCMEIPIKASVCGFCTLQLNYEG
jgi:large conductance mechanosensitive channel